MHGNNLEFGLFFKYSMAGRRKERLAGSGGSYNLLWRICIHFQTTPIYLDLRNTDAHTHTHRHTNPEEKGLAVRVSLAIIQLTARRRDVLWFIQTAFLCQAHLKYGLKLNVGSKLNFLVQTKCCFCFVFFFTSTVMRSDFTKWTEERRRSDLTVTKYLKTSAKIHTNTLLPLRCAHSLTYRKRLIQRGGWHRSKWKIFKPTQTL